MDRKFTEQEREKLKSAFDNGLQSSSKSKSLEIQQLASEMGCTEQKIKNFIGNERRKRKGEPSQKPPQKLRCPNAYNLFTKEFRKCEDAKKLTLTEQNKKAAELWHGLSDDDKSRYYSASAAAQTEVGESQPQAWKEVKRILNNMQSNCQWAEKLDIQCCFMVTHGPNHYVGGTQCGRDFLQDNLHLPVLFLSDVQNRKAKSIHECTSSISELRNRIQEELNAKYSLSTGDPTGKIVYAEINASQVVGWPQSVRFCHPNNLSKSELQKVSSVMKQIKFKLAAKPPARMNKNFDHTYCKIVPGNFHQDAQPSLGSTSLQTESSSTSLPTGSIEASKKVKLLHHGRQIGIGTVIDGTILHGVELPDGYLRVIVDEIRESVAPPVKGKFTEAYVTVGEIHGWPVVDVNIDG